MWKGIRSRSKRDSKRSKEKLANDTIDVLQDTETSAAAISKHDLKRRWGSSELSGDLLQFAGDLLDHLVKGPETATVGGEIHTAFQDAIALHSHPGRQPNLETREGFHQKQAGAQRVGDDEYIPTHPLQRAEADREDEDDSYCAQAATDEDEIDERVQPATKQKESKRSLVFVICSSCVYS